MSTPAADIDDVIAMAASDIAAVSYEEVESLQVQMALWNAGMFAESGIFPPSANAGSQRAVSNWYGTSSKAYDTIEGPAPGGASIFATSNCINAVVRAAYAVKYAAIDGTITTTQEDDVVTLYNTVWQPA